jgi:hypothetical protein
MELTNRHDEHRLYVVRETAPPGWLVAAYSVLCPGCRQKERDEREIDAAR